MNTQKNCLDNFERLRSKYGKANKKQKLDHFVQLFESENQAATIVQKKSR